MTPWNNEKFFYKLILVYLAFVATFLSFFYRFDIDFNKVIQSINYLADWILYFETTKDFKSIKNIQWQPLMVAVSSLAFLLFSSLLLIKIYRYKAPLPYGNSKFATLFDVKKMGIIENKQSTGLIVGKIGKTYLSTPKTSHGIVLAPTGSGKTAGFVIPTALSFKGSLIITDPKGELEALLAKPLQKMGKKVYSIDWADAFSKDAWNPLSLKVFASVYKNQAEAERQAERISAMIIPKTGGSDEHWTNTARRNLSALILFVVCRAEFFKELYEMSPEDENIKRDYEEYGEPHLSKIYNLIGGNINLNDLNSLDNDDILDDFKSVLIDLMKKAILYKCPNRVTVDLNLWKMTPSTEAGSHLSTLMTKLQLWRSLSVSGSTKEASFEWKELREKESVVFLQFPQHDASAFGELTALFFESFFAWNLSTSKEKNDLDIVILADEFGSLPKISLMSDFLSKARSQGGAIWIIVQDLMQIQKIYGKEDLSTIRTNCTYLLVYSQNNDETQGLLTKIVGRSAHEKISKSKQDKGGYSKSYSDEGVDLIDISSWGNIPFGHHILLMVPYLTKPIFCKSTLYFREKRFLKFFGKKTLLERLKICR